MVVCDSEMNVFMLETDAATMGKLPLKAGGDWFAAP
jgi:hypothetical protein